MLGDAEELKAEYMLVEDYHITEMQDLLQCKDLSVRIRYRSKPIPCQVLVLDEKQLLVRFLSEASAIAPGQSAVFLRGETSIRRCIHSFTARHPKNCRR